MLFCFYNKKEMEVLPKLMFDMILFKRFLIMLMNIGQNYLRRDPAVEKVVNSGISIRHDVLDLGRLAGLVGEN